ncbi:hypothetical protein ACFRSX_32750 [Streptomyces goshikiensis]|uniref:hypothetical protein n=1 Tax=Streptomyces TaxID=1883 RepID=UPI000C272F59|nr:hypothetical protein [Streptomyces sp. CB02120-2]PJN14551.1 hypothetical protein CG724_33200 [Streptomyces sp. CB02120-2]
MTNTVPDTANTDFDAVLTANLRRAAGTLPLTTGILQLLGTAAQTEARLAAAEAVFPGITRLTDDKPPTLTVHTVTRHGLPLGTYATREAARAKGEACLKCCPLPEGVTTLWAPDNGGEHAPEDLMTFGPGPDDESVTSIRITVQSVLVDYDPEAEG